MKIGQFSETLGGFGDQHIHLGKMGLCRVVP